jgi:hypothetical protein
MNPDDSRDLVQRAWKAFATRDAARIAPFFTEDAEWLAPPGNATAVALGGTHHMAGRAAVVALLARDVPRMFGGVRITFHGFHAGEDVVTVEETMDATLPDGRPYQNDYCFVFELRGDRIHRVREYMDTARAARTMRDLEPRG